MQKFFQIIMTISFLIINSYAQADNRQEINNQSEPTQESKQQSNIDSVSADKNNTDINIAYTAPIVYDLPNPGAPDTSRLIGAGTRDKEHITTYISVLTPKHTGLTFNKQPTLYWFTSESIEIPVEFVLISDQSHIPVLKIPIPAPQKAGIQHISLEDYSIDLEPGVEYRWSIALIQNPLDRTHDIVTSGKIMRTVPPESVVNRLKQTPDDTKALIYARKGIWYDMLTTLNTSILQQPTNKSLRNDRVRLLEQVGLSIAAEHERK